MKVPLQKIRIVGLRKHYKLFMQELHRKGILEVVENEAFIEASEKKIEDHFGVFDLARIDFAIRFLTPYAPAKSKFDMLLAGGKLVMNENEAKDKLKAFSPSAEAIIGEAETIEETLVRSKNELTNVARQQDFLLPFQDLNIPLQENFSTEKTVTWIGKVSASKHELLVEELALVSNLVDVETLSDDPQEVALRVTTERLLEQEVQEVLNQNDFLEVDFSLDTEEFMGEMVRDVIKKLSDKKADLLKQMKDAQVRLPKLAVHLDELKILYDYNNWRKTKNDLQKNIFQSHNIFAFEAWIPQKHFKELKKWIEKIFVGEVSLEEIKPNKEEKAPTLLHNRRPVSCFEPITEMFGMPGGKDMDPTPFLAPFFFVFFGLCLSDVGYGGVLTLMGLFFFLFGKFSRAAKDGLLLLVLCGLSAMAGGVILGGYFGITPEQAPEMLLNTEYLAGNSEVLPFRYQMLNPMEGSGPIMFLVLTMVLGVIQLLFGVVADFIRRIKNKEYAGALMDPGAWFFFLVSLLGYAMADRFGLDKALFARLTQAGMVILILTQGRDQENIILKPVFGLFGLYNVMGYMSDLLSYSRVMALGLATGVIGFAMNLTASILSGMMPHPILGYAIALVVLLCGHGLNFSLSLLGAFVHSGRLQFIEFFDKFYEGSGRKFKPFVRQKRYLFFS